MSPPTNIDGTEITGASIDGQDVQEITVDGQTVFSAIPDSVLTQYRYEDDGDTTTAIDSVGTNDATINGSTYTATAAVGNFGIDHDGTDDNAVSNSTVDLSTVGSTDGFGFGGFVQADTTSQSLTMFTLFNDINNRVGIQFGGNGTGFNTFFVVNGTFESGTESGTVPTSSFGHIWTNVDQTNLTLYFDNSQIDQFAHGHDITNLGLVQYTTGNDNQNQFFFDGKVDEFTISDDPLNSTDRQTLVDRGA